MSNEQVSQDVIWYRTNPAEFNGAQLRIVLTMVLSNPPGDMVMGRLLDIHFGHVRPCDVFPETNHGKCEILECDDQKHYTLKFFKDNNTLLTLFESILRLNRLGQCGLVKVIIGQSEFADATVLKGDLVTFTQEELRNIVKLKSLY